VHALALVGEVAIAASAAVFKRTPMLCIGYAKVRADEGCGAPSIDRDPSPVAMLTAFVSRHPLPQGAQGERGKKERLSVRYAVSAIQFDRRHHDLAAATCLVFFGIELEEIRACRVLMACSSTAAANGC